MAELFIKPEYLKMLTDIFDRYCPVAEIWAYGSRIKNEAHSGSDWDLAVKDFHGDDKNIYDLKALINESNIPFIVDIHELKQLPESFQKEIEKDYIVIYG